MKSFPTLAPALLLGLSLLAPAARAQNCVAPTNVAIATPAATTAVVSFAPAGAALSYTVRYSWVGDSSAAGVMNANVVASPATLTGLRLNATYVVRVISNCGSGGTAVSAPQVFRSRAGASSCAAPTGVTATASGPSGLVLGFAAVPGAVGYSLRYFAAGDSTNVRTLAFSSPPLALTGLLPNRSYVLLLSTDCGGGSVSAPVRAMSRTGAAASACGSATNLVLAATSATTASLSFVPGVGNTSYSVTYSTPGDSTRRAVGSVSPLVLNGLVAGNTYTVTVTSVCGTGPTATTTSAAPVPFAFRGALKVRNGLEQELALYPNPAHRAVRVVLPAMPGAATARLLLLNGLGQAVRSATVPLGNAATTAELLLENLPAGLYTLRATAGGQSATQRLAVE